MANMLTCAAEGGQGVEHVDVNFPGVGLGGDDVGRGEVGLLCYEVVEGLKESHLRPIGREGTSASHWVLVDYGSVVVHVFTPPDRDFYQLERHWSEAKTVLRVQ